MLQIPSQFFFFQAASEILNLLDPLFSRDPHDNHTHENGLHTLNRIETPLSKATHWNVSFSLWSLRPTGTGKWEEDNGALVQ